MHKAETHRQSETNEGLFMDHGKTQKTMRAYNEHASKPRPLPYGWLGIALASLLLVFLEHTIWLVNGRNEYWAVSK